MTKIIKWSIEKLAHLIPKSKFYLPLYFKNNRYFQSKRITILSFLIICFVMLNVLDTFNKIGSVQNITMSTVKFIPNINLTQKYKTIQLKPRKYEDSILPYFKINFNNSTGS